MKNLLRVALYTAAGACLAMLADVVIDSKSDYELRIERYCTGVNLFKSTGGEQGWPDYELSYQQDCK